MSMSDAALHQADTAPSMVATWKPFVFTCRAFLEENTSKPHGRASEDQCVGQARGKFTRSNSGMDELLALARREANQNSARSSVCVRTELIVPEG